MRRATGRTGGAGRPAIPPTRVALVRPLSPTSSARLSRRSASATFASAARPAFTTQGGRVTGPAPSTRTAGRTATSAPTGASVGSSGRSSAILAAIPQAGGGAGRSWSGTLGSTHGVAAGAFGGGSADSPVIRPVITASSTATSFIRASARRPTPFGAISPAPRPGSTPGPCRLIITAPGRPTA